MSGVIHEVLVDYSEDDKVGFETVCGEYDAGDKGSLTRDRVNCPECLRWVAKHCPDCNRGMSEMDRDQDGARQWGCSYCKSKWTQVLDVEKEFAVKKQA